MSATSNISQVVIFHRDLGCSDESSTDEEQGERILYFFPRETSLFMQLSRLSMIEGLIGFAEKFSEEPIDVVVMENSTWAFYQCEHNVWIVLAVSNENNLRESMSNIKLRPSGPALQECLVVLSIFYILYLL